MVASARNRLCRGDLLDGVTNSRERGLQLERPRRVGVGQLTPNPALAQPQEELFRRALVDALGGGTGVELRIESSAGNQLLAEPLMFLRVEMLRAQLGQDRHQRAMRGDACESVALEPLSRVEQLRRDPSRQRRRRAWGK